LLLAFGIPLSASAEKGGRGILNLVAFEGGEASMTIAMPNERLAPAFDGGSARGLADVSVGARSHRGFARAYTTVVPWRQARATDSAFKIDVVGVELGPRFGLGSDERRVEIRFLAGGYYPLRWERTYAELYQDPRISLGIAALVDAGFFRVEGVSQYVWPLSGQATIEVDGATTKFDTEGYWYAKAMGEVDLVGLVRPVGEIGVFGFSGSMIKGAMGTEVFDASRVTYVNFGLSVAPIPNALVFQAKIHRLLGKVDESEVEYATGRRALIELTNGYSLGVIGRF
jgi:hypothetical protein